MHLTTPMGMSGVLIVQRRMWERDGITPESGDLTPGIWHLTTCYFCFWSNLPTQERFGCALILLCIFKKADSMFLGTFYEWAGWEVPADERACRHRRCWVPPRTLGYVRHLPCPHLVFLPRELSIVLWPFKRLRCLFKSTSLLIHLTKGDLKLTSMTSSIIDIYMQYDCEQRFKWHWDFSPCFRDFHHVGRSTAFFSWSSFSHPFASRPGRQEIQTRCNRRHRRGQSLCLDRDIWTCDSSFVNQTKQLPTPTLVHLVPQGTSQGHRLSPAHPPFLMRCTEASAAGR